MSLSPSPKSVLVVEDDMAIARLVSRALEAEGFWVDLAHDGEAALGQLQQAPDVVLLDVNLPKLDGYTVAKLMKASPTLRGIPIIFMTAMDRPRDIILGIQAGARHYLTKPFRTEDLVSKVRKATSFA